MNNGTLKLLGFLVVFSGAIGGFSYQVASRPTEDRVKTMIEDKVAVQSAQIDNICIRLEKIENAQHDLVKAQRETNRVLDQLVGELRARSR